MSIRPDNLTLDKLLQGRLFRILDYQRAYSWESKQRRDLFGDIKKLAQEQNSGRHHFMSTVVCLQTKQKEEIGADEFGIYHVVDGQQRLTTLIILLKALAKKLTLGNDTEVRESSKLKELLVKEQDGRLILLQTNHDSKLLFRRYLEKGEIPDKEQAETQADRNMIEAFTECEEFVNEWQPDSLSLLKLVKNRLDFIFYVLEDEGAVHTTFEVLNSRGLEVDWLDKCKSILMGIAFGRLVHAGQDCVQEIHSYWSKIYRTIGLKKIQGHEILRFAATLEATDVGKSKISSAESAIDFFRKKCEEDPRSVVSVSLKFLEIAEKLEYFVTNPRLKAVTEIVHTRLLAVAIMLNKNLEPDDKKKVLKEWEKVTFRIFGLHRRDARTKVGEYVRLARKICNDTILVTDMIREITFLGEDFPAADAEQKLREVDCYEGWEEELIYFLYRYEEHLACECSGSISEEVWIQVWNSSPAKTIEHIHPQHLNYSWRGKFGTKKELVERQSQRLGNLTLLPPGVNSQASDKAFVEKKKIYERHRHLKLNDEILDKEDWDHEAMLERESRLIAWASKEWE